MATRTNPDHTSEAEEMYLITVARQTERGEAGPVPVATVAGELGVSIASANEMVRKLAGRELVTYEPYRGVALTQGGRAVADRVLRTRRLWATFLADRLGFSPAEADAQACDLEHVTSASAADRLAEFLGNPRVGPLGHPIPQVGAAPEVYQRLDETAVGERLEVTEVAATGGSLAFLTAEGIEPGAAVIIEASGGSGVLVRIGSTALHLPSGLAATVSGRVVAEPH